MRFFNFKWFDFYTHQMVLKIYGKIEKIPCSWYFLRKAECVSFRLKKIKVTYSLDDY